MRRILLGLLLVGLSAAPVPAEDAAKFTVHESALWIIEQDAKLANARNAFKPGLPGSSVRMTAQAPAQPNQPGMVFQAQPMIVGINQVGQVANGVSNIARNTAPVAMLTFHGEAAGSLDVEVRSKRGALLAHWPPGDATSNRLRWSDNAPTRLVVKADDASSLPFVEADHWIRQARENEALFVSRGARTERFLGYDAELQMTSPTKLEIKGDTLTLTNISPYTLHDVLIAQPTAEGTRVAWLDTLPPAKIDTTAKTTATAKAATDRAPADTAPADTAPKALSDDMFSDENFEAPAAADASKPSETQAEATAGLQLTMSSTLAHDSTELAQQTRGELTKRLLKAGLNDAEVDLYLTRYASRFFDETAVIVACRLDAAAIDEALPLSIFPAPAQTMRVHYVVSRNADPRLGSEVDRLIVQLGDKTFSVREIAQKRLLELGAVAYPSLQKAVGHADLEVVIRAERILLNQNQTPNAAPPAAAKPNAAQAAPAAPPALPAGRVVVPN